MPSPVTSTPAVPPSEAADHFAHKLALETDCADVQESLKGGAPDFVLLDVRGRPAFAGAHVPGATSLPHREITPERMMAGRTTRCSSSTAPVPIATAPTGQRCACPGLAGL